MRVFLIVLAAVALSAIAPAAAQNRDQKWCSDTWQQGEFDISTVKQITLMRAAEAPKTYFLERNGYKAGCPQKGIACRKAYVLPGQEVLVVGETGSDYLCAVFPNKDGDTQGWISRTALATLAAQPRQPQPLQAWGGTWNLHEGNFITIKIVGEILAGYGLGLWHENDGEFSAKAKPQNDRVVFDDRTQSDDCKVSARLFGDYLLVSDNHHCGGLNVRFFGIYRRAKPH